MGDLQASTTRAPRCASAVAVAFPMPAFAPVTMQTLPDMVVLLLVGNGCLPREEGSKGHRHGGKFLFRVKPVLSFLCNGVTSSAFVVDIVRPQH